MSPKHERGSIVTKTMSLLLIAGVIAGALAGGAAVAQSEPDMGPRLIAVKFHADWCGFCKAMGPVFTELQQKYDGLPVLYVEFDQTTKSRKRQAAYLAKTMGLDRVWKEHGGKTGFILLIDPNTKAVIKKLTKDQNLKQMGASLQEAVGKSDGCGCG